MKVTINNKKEVFFKEITMGTFFFYEGNLFLKVNDDSDILNAYCFEDEEFVNFYKIDLVIPVSIDKISINVNT